ncbi:putative iron sulfur assembly protein [Cercophora samala]|uniref:Iron sulfur assembly protein n=1 Tax=Cercophora samala TaxID=330535 RepID=A0AA39ZGP7_9PEZI|nr:putative iron sulfur assembly protein [Cercophora samala]
MPPLPCINPPTPASVFIQLSMRHRAITTSPSILDFLLPLPVRGAPVPTRAHHSVSAARTYQISHQPGHTQIAARSSRPWRVARHSPQGNPARRTFTTTTPRFASAALPSGTTRALFNPQTDDDGQEMMLEITPRAAKRLSEIMAKDSNPYLALRIQVESGGCHGFQYLMKLVTLPPSLPPTPQASASLSAGEGGDGVTESTSAIGEDDTIFTFAADEESATADLTAPKIILDTPSLELLKGSKVDFTMELIGSQFKIVDNPLATSSCGCGTSFDIKM